MKKEYVLVILVLALAVIGWFLLVQEDEPQLSSGWLPSCTEDIRTCYVCDGNGGSQKCGCYLMTYSGWPFGEPYQELVCKWHRASGSPCAGHPEGDIICTPLPPKNPVDHEPVGP
ncbi:MAG: hypothetical protein ABH864_04315 [archaeon]